MRLKCYYAWPENVLTLHANRLRAYKGYFTNRLRTYKDSTTNKLRT